MDPSGAVGRSDVNPGMVERPSLPRILEEGLLTVEADVELADGDRRVQPRAPSEPSRRLSATFARDHFADSRP
jgi:hypothetical protein